jgi:AcrR family transcriptional regulator
MSKFTVDSNTITKFAFTKFLQEGFYKITMDEIAKEMRISKKTIYKHFPSKENLIDSALEMAMSQLQNSLREITERNDNAVVKLKLISEFIINFAKNVSPKWLNDLQMHGQAKWNKVEEKRKQIILETFTIILEQGKKEGLISERPNNLVLTIIISSIQGVINPEFLINNAITFKQAGEMTLEILFMGVLSKKGRKIYKQIKSGN